MFKVKIPEPRGFLTMSDTIPWERNANEIRGYFFASDVVFVYPLFLPLPLGVSQADPEIQQILRDPQMSIVLQNAQENPAMLKE